MGKYLEDTIKSVLSNLRDGDEYFIIDGGSTDGSIDIIRRYESRLSGWVSEPDRGYADAIGKGFGKVSGDILCWINAGDIYLSGAFDAARGVMTNDLDLIFGDDFHIDEESRVISHSSGWVPSLRAATLYGTWTPLQDACFWRRDLYHKVGGIDRSLKYAADYDLFLRMALAGRAEYVPMTFSAFRRHDGQKSVSGAAAYQVERMQVRARELEKIRRPKAVKFAYGGFNRASMSFRSRLASSLLLRTDLAGTNVTTLPCAAYGRA